MSPRSYGMCVKSIGEEFFCVPKRFLPPVSTVPTVTPNTNILSQPPTERGQWGQLPRPMLNYT